MKLRSSRVIGKHCQSVTTLSLPTTSNMTSIKSQALNGNENESVLLRSSAGDVQSVTSLHASRACEVATCSNQISTEHDNADPLNAAGSCKEQAAQLGLQAFPGHSSQTHILSRSSDDLDQGRVATSLHASSACEVATSYEQISTEHGNGDYISRGVDCKEIGYQRVSVNPGLVSSCRVDMGEGGRHVSRPTQSVVRQNIGILGLNLALSNYNRFFCIFGWTISICLRISWRSMPKPCGFFKRWPPYH